MKKKIIITLLITVSSITFFSNGDAPLARDTSGNAAAWLRVNQAGYTPDRPKIAIVMSDSNITTRIWTLKKDGNTVLSGNLPAGRQGNNIFVRQRFTHTIDFSSVRERGIYTLELPYAETQQIIISDDPYSLYATQAIMWLRLNRSGGQTLYRNPSHLGDRAAIVYNVKGDWKNGEWQEATPRRTVDMLGGHYDAGNLIKFTLCEANLAWHLLMAYQFNPRLFVKVHSTSNLPDILDEAKYSLDWLAKTFPDNNTFIIQVGDKKDHDEGWRLPENDRLDGRRPALNALSRTHMGVTAAALALGAHVFKNIDPAAAALYESKAIAIYARARQSDTLLTAFESDATADFYDDTTDTDNMALAAAELYNLTKNNNYLNDARAYAPPSLYGVNWKDLNVLANYRLAELGDDAARRRLFEETARYEQYARENVWNLTSNWYSWSTLPMWMGPANIHLLAQRLNGRNELPAPFLGVLDYTFGRNNWGISMLASADLPYSIRNIYSFVWHVLKLFPVGALSEGPGDIATHNSLKHIFNVPSNSPFERFNTSGGVFYDNAHDFMIQESTIWGQGNLILMLALASSRNLSPAASAGTLPFPLDGSAAATSVREGTVAGFSNWQTINSPGSTITRSTSQNRQRIRGNITGEIGYAIISATPNAATLTRMKAMTSFSFMVMGDGKQYEVLLPTTETNTTFNHYRYTFTAPNTETRITVNVPADLRQADWGGVGVVPFNLNNVQSFQFQLSGTGAFDLTVWDVRIIQ
ncbi:MAG: CIA30 family protein [Treponema sp.]|nr:CIA30 family protein [Treponema sp.]